MIRYSQKTIRKFCTINLLTLVKETSSDLSHFKRPPIKELQNQLNLILKSEEQKNEMHKTLSRSLLSASINSNTPLKSVLQLF